MPYLFSILTLINRLTGVYSYTQKYVTLTFIQQNKLTNFIKINMKTVHVFVKLAQNSTGLESGLEVNV